MIRVAGYDIDGCLNYIQGGQYAEVEIGIPASANLSEKDIDVIKAATLVEEIFVVVHGEEERLVGSYALYGWRRINREWDGSIQIAWQTSRTTEVNDLKEQLAAAQSENEILSQAVAELGQLVSDLKGESE